MAAPEKIEIPPLLRAPSASISNNESTWWDNSTSRQSKGGNYGANKLALFTQKPSIAAEFGAGSACLPCHPALTQEKSEEVNQIAVKESVRRAALELMKKYRISVADAYDRDMKNDEAIDDVVKVSEAIEKFNKLDRELYEDEAKLRSLGAKARRAGDSFDPEWLGDLAEYTKNNRDEPIRKELEDFGQYLLHTPSKRADKNSLLQIKAIQFEKWRNAQRKELAENIQILYWLHPFFGITPPRLISRVGTAPKGETIGPAYHINERYNTLLSSIDNLIEKIASDDINPLQLPMAVELAKSQMNEKNINLLNELLNEREQNETLKNVGIAFAMGIGGSLGVLGEGGLFAAAGGATDLAVGVLFADQLEEHFDRLALQSASDNPDGSMLSVPAISGGDSIMLIVNGVLTTLGLLGLARGIKGQMKPKLANSSALKGEVLPPKTLPPSVQLPSGNPNPRKWDPFTGKYKNWPERIPTPKASGPFLERVGAPNSKSELNLATLTPKSEALPPEPLPTPTSGKAKPAREMIFDGVVTKRPDGLALPPKLTAEGVTTSSGKIPLPDTIPASKNFPKKPVAWKKPPNKPNKIIGGVEKIPPDIAAWDLARMKGSSGNGSAPAQAQIFLHEPPMVSIPIGEPSTVPSSGEFERSMAGGGTKSNEPATQKGEAGGNIEFPLPTAESVTAKTSSSNKSNYFDNPLHPERAAPVSEIVSPLSKQPEWIAPFGPPQLKEKFQHVKKQIGKVSAPENLPQPNEKAITSGEWHQDVYGMIPAENLSTDVSLANTQTPSTSQFEGQNELTLELMEARSKQNVPQNEREVGSPGTAKFGESESRAGINLRLYDAAEVALSMRKSYSPEHGGYLRYVEFEAPEISGNFGTRPKEFIQDELAISAEVVHPTNDDLTGTGYERGHIAAQENSGGDPDVARALMVTTNMWPMRGLGSTGVNQGAYRSFERAYKALKSDNPGAAVHLRIEAVVGNPPTFIQGSGNPVLVPDAFNITVIFTPSSGGGPPIVTNFLLPN